MVISSSEGALAHLDARYAVPAPVGHGSASIRSFTAKGTPSSTESGLPASYLRHAGVKPIRTRE